MKQFLLIATGFLTAFASHAVIVKCTQCANLDGRIETLSVQNTTTGENTSTLAAPHYFGYIFTGWSSSDIDSVTTRDDWGVALASAVFIPYQDIVLTANYLPENLDTDSDGIPDGWELYWYGTLDETGTSDTDDDELNFEVELHRGARPVFPDVDGPCAQRAIVRSGDVLYNPTGVKTYTIRSDPENSLFGTSSQYATNGTVITTTKHEFGSGGFAGWEVDGVRVTDEWGRSVKQVSFVMGSNEVVATARCFFDERELWAYYYYGDVEGNPTDSDADGLSFDDELEYGTNPLFSDSGVVANRQSAFSGIIQYNPNSLVAYVLKSNPEGTLISTTSDYLQTNDSITTVALSPRTSNFAYWTVNGLRIVGSFGRSAESVTFAGGGTQTVEVIAHAVDDEFTRWSWYYYGKGNQSADSDTDADGISFAEELWRGTSPVFADRGIEACRSSAQSGDMEVNLQVYEQLRGTLIQGQYVELFTSPIADNKSTSMTFLSGGTMVAGGEYGVPIWPVVADLNGDGLWDLIICSSTATNIFLNTGTKGNPQFGKSICDADIASRVDLTMNSTEKITDLQLDIVPTLALSATTNGTALLVSDTEGRIWYYTSQNSQNYALQYKVWGGSHPGFATGLRLAAVDWENDGDLDCLAGTAEGKLMLLRDPKVGRPTNLTTHDGIDNINLTWDPNVQSRIRGYKVYRSEADADAYANITSPYTPLPFYRDYPPVVRDYDYKVSSVSRFYTAGNSTPTESESMKTDAVRAQLGNVRFFWNDVVCMVGETASVMLSIENALNFNVTGRVQVVSYDPEYLEPAELVSSGLAEKIKYTSSFADGQWTITLTEGVLPAGSGKFFTLIFRTLKAGETWVGGGRGATALPTDETAGATVTIASAPTYQLGDVNGDGKVDLLDLRLLAKLKSTYGRKYTSDQLRAGDFNGNGKLDNADYQALRALLKKLGVLK